MRIILDRQAMAALIAADPDFELELKNSVISEVGRRFFIKDSDRVIAAANKELFTQALAALQRDADMMALIGTALKAQLTSKPEGYWQKLELSGQTKALIDQRVTQLKDRMINEASNEITKAYNDFVDKAVKDKVTAVNIDELVEKRVTRLVDMEINRRVDEKVKAKFAELLA